MLESYNDEMLGSRLGKASKVLTIVLPVSAGFIHGYMDANNIHQSELERSLTFMPTIVSAGLIGTSLGLESYTVVKDVNNHLLSTMPKINVEEHRKDDFKFVLGATGMGILGGAILGSVATLSGYCAGYFIGKTQNL